jgi:hypothetical protein
MLASAYIAWTCAYPCHWRCDAGICRMRVALVSASLIDAHVHVLYCFCVYVHTG